MRGKYWALSMLVLTLGCAAVFAPGAAAAKHKPKPVALLPQRGCKGVLDITDFPGAVGETSLLGGALSSGEASSKAGSYFTTCEFHAPPPTEADPNPPEGGGLDELAVYDRFLFEHPKNHNLTEYFPWPPGVPKNFDRIRLSSRAYVGYDEGIGYGLVQVRNDVFFFYTKATDVLSLLGIVTSELCAGCK